MVFITISYNFAIFASLRVILFGWELPIAYTVEYNDTIDSYPINGL